MIRFFIVILLTLSAAFSASAQGMQPLNQVSIVALIITSGEETPVSASVTRTLESLDAQVLTASAPNASQMRSVLKRFASAAIDVDVALVYYDGAVLKIGDREFVAPGGITLRRRSDLLTKAIPLSALARATALAGNGGAVLVHSNGQGVDLIDGVTLVEAAPSARTGTSPILFASSAAAIGLADGLEAMAASSGDINLSDALRGLSELDGVSISQLPLGAAMLRVLPAPEMTTASDETVADTAEATMAAEEPADTNSATSLPQVGADTPEADTAAEVVANVEALDTDGQAEDMTDSTEAVSDAGTTAENTADMVVSTAEDDAAAAAALAADAELSIDVLRAMQGALSRGQKRMLQRHLRNMGYYRGLIDGIFGPQSERAISAYQDTIGATMTGFLTPMQLEALSE